MPKSSNRRLTVVYGLLLVVGLAILWQWLLPERKLDADSFKIPAMICAAGVSAVVLLESSFHVLRFGKPLGLPGAFLAPMLQSAMVALIASLGTTSPSGIQRPPESLEPATIWLDWKALALCASAQALALMVYGAVHTPDLDSEGRHE